jgi:hypothetical protein
MNDKIHHKPPLLALFRIKINQLIVIINHQQSVVFKTTTNEINGNF